VARFTTAWSHLATAAVTAALFVGLIAGWVAATARMGQKRIASINQQDIAPNASTPTIHVDPMPFKLPSELTLSKLTIVDESGREVAWLGASSGRVSLNLGNCAELYSAGDGYSHLKLSNTADHTISLIQAAKFASVTLESFDADGRDFAGGNAALLRSQESWIKAAGADSPDFSGTRRGLPVDDGRRPAIKKHSVHLGAGPTQFSIGGTNLGAPESSHGLSFNGNDAGLVWDINGRNVPLK
jgi:hypothetical protein